MYFLCKKINTCASFAVTPFHLCDMEVQIENLSVCLLNIYTSLPCTKFILYSFLTIRIHCQVNCNKREALSCFVFICNDVLWLVPAVINVSPTASSAVNHMVTVSPPMYVSVTLATWAIIAAQSASVTNTATASVSKKRPTAWLVKTTQR